MPRYFFHLAFGRRVWPDEEGVELPNRSTARDEAVAVVRDLAKPELVRNSRRWASWFIEVADEQGRFFRTPIGHPALEIVTPDTDKARVNEPASMPVRPTASVHFSRDGSGRARRAEIVRQRAQHQRWTAHLLEDNERLRRELSSICLTSEAILDRTRRLVAVARGMGVHIGAPA